MNQPLIAVFGDIHSNLEALTAVLADMNAQGVTDRVCLGDIVGYGANPAKCLKLVRDLNCPIVRGNHDDAASLDSPLTGMGDLATAGIEYSRNKLNLAERAFLRALPLVVNHSGCRFVHASLHKPEEWCYVTGPGQAIQHFNSQDVSLCFCGHTHQPCIWSHRDSEWPSGRNGRGVLTLESDTRTLVNVGSVGQPRDFNPDACYVIYRPAEKTVEFRRVEYAIAKTRKKISRAKLPKFLGQRLALGR